MAVGLYFLLRPRFGTETLSWVCILGAFPFAAMGFIKYNGMTVEQFVWSCKDTYGRIRMYQALIFKNLEHVDIPSERTVYRVIEKIGHSHHPKCKPNGSTKADYEVYKSDDLLKRDFQSRKLLTKCVTDMTESKASNECESEGTLYVETL